MLVINPSADASYSKEFDKSGTQRVTGADLYSLLIDAANDALPIIDAPVSQIADRMNQYLVSRLSSTFPYFDVFLTLEQGAGSGALGWGQGGEVFTGMALWAGFQGVLPGIGARYGVFCTVVWL